MFWRKSVSKDFNIDEFEVKIWEDALNKAEKEMNNAKQRYDKDPLTELLSVQVEAAKLLEENQGVQARTSPEFIKKISQLAKREKAAKKLHDKGVDILNLGNIYYDKKLRRDLIAQKYNMVKFIYDSKRKR